MLSALQSQLKGSPSHTSSCPTSSPWPCYKKLQPSLSTCDFCVCVSPDCKRWRKTTCQSWRTPRSQRSMIIETNMVRGWRRDYPNKTPKLPKLNWINYLEPPPQIKYPLYSTQLKQKKIESMKCFSLAENLTVLADTTVIYPRWLPRVVYLYKGWIYFYSDKLILCVGCNQQTGLFPRNPWLSTPGSTSLLYLKILQIIHIHLEAASSVNLGEWFGLFVLRFLQGLKSMTEGCKDEKK